MRFEAGVISRVRGHKTVAYARSGVAPDIGSAPRRNWLGKKSISVQIVGNEKVGGVNQLHQDFAISAEELLDSFEAALPQLPPPSGTTWQPSGVPLERILAPNCTRTKPGEVTECPSNAWKVWMRPHTPPMLNLLKSENRHVLSLCQQIAGPDTSSNALLGRDSDFFLRFMV